MALMPVEDFDLIAESLANLWDGCDSVSSECALALLPDSAPAPRRPAVGVERVRHAPGVSLTPPSSRSSRRRTVAVTCPTVARTRASPASNRWR